jgi:hypothetical protein
MGYTSKSALHVSPSQASQITAHRLLTNRLAEWISQCRNDPQHHDPQTGKAVLWSSIRQTSTYKERSAPFVMAIATSRPDTKKAFTPESPTCESIIELALSSLILMQSSLDRRIHAWRIWCLASQSQRFDTNRHSWFSPPGVQKSIKFKLCERIRKRRVFRSSHLLRIGIRSSQSIRINYSIQIRDGHV